MNEDYVLTDAQARIVISLALERERVVAAANKKIADIVAAEKELADLIRQTEDLPNGEYRFDGNLEKIRLVRDPAQDKK